MTSTTIAAKPSFSWLAVTIVFFVPGLADFLYGYDCGAISYALLQMQSEDSGVTWGNELVHRPALRGFVVSGCAIGAFVASSFIVSIDASRIRELQVGALLYIAGALLQVTSSLIEIPALAIVLFFCGRFVYGLGIGISMHAAPAYLSEMSPSSIRGVVMSMKEAANTIGLLVGYALGHAYSSRSGGWVLTFASSTIFAATSFAVSFFLPKSARWLMVHGKEDQARQSLGFIYRDEAIENTLSEIKRYCPSRQESSEFVVAARQQLWDPSNRQALVCGVGIIALQQLTGSPAMLAYASTVFDETGHASNSAVHMAIFQLIATLASAGLVEICGRKMLLYIGCSSMTISLIVLSICFGRYNGNVILVAMFVYIGGFQVGFGPIAWLIVAEVFSNLVRGQAVALCVQVNFSTYGLVQFAIPVIASILEFNGTFALFGMLSAYRYEQNMLCPVKNYFISSKRLYKARSNFMSSYVKCLLCL
jgi:sugar porter (SP) family MFS transporter